VHGDTTSEAARLRLLREKMVAKQLRARDIRDPRVLKAMQRVPRHRFVPPDLVSKAYADHPLPIGEGQTISQPYIVALMTQTLDLDPSAHVLEIGTGSGYQAAVLAEIVAKVTSIEIKALLYRRATATLEALGYTNVSTHHGDGYYGFTPAAPFDAIMITAAVDHIPPPLLQQLKDGGRLILPYGNPLSYQYLVLVTREGDDFRQRQIAGVRFVPMTGQALKGRP
jgi:protein-L-isoaspartate(D-aspartate) O-methyltransferase